MWIFHALCSGCSTRTLMTASRSPTTQPSLDRTPQWACSSFSRSWNYHTVNQRQHCMGEWWIIQVAFSPNPGPWTALSSYQAMSGNCTHCAEPVHSGTTHCKCHPSSPPIRYFSHERIWRLGIDYGVHSRHIQTMPCHCPATENVWATGGMHLPLTFTMF